MSSAVGSVASSLSSNPPSPPSVPPGYTPSSFGVNTVFLLILPVTVSPIPSASASAPVTTPTQQSSSASQTTMSVTVTATTVPTSASTSVPSSIAFPTLTSVSSTSSSAVITATSTPDSRSTTSTPESSVQPTTTAPVTTQSSTVTSPPPTTSLPGTTSPSTPISSAPSTSNTSFTTTSSSLSLHSSSQSSSSVSTDLPLTTVLESATIFITSTDSQGQVMTSAPPIITKVITTTGSSGIVTTVTQAIVNPTLAPNDSTTGGSSFFTDTGAVVGVFVVVGLSCASIMMWILFALRRRQRMSRIEQDTAVEAAVAAAGLNRAPLDDDDDEGGSLILPSTLHQFSSDMGQRESFLGLRGSDSLPTSAQLSKVLDDPARDSANSHPGCPVEYPGSSHPDGYVPARTTSPSPRAERCIEDLGSSRDRKSSYGHTPTYSAGSFEPLLANFSQNMSDQDTSALAMDPPRNRSPRHRLVPNGYSSDGSPEDGSRRTSLKGQNSSDSSVLRDEEDYTRYVLTVRNMPDDQSQHSS